jgi:rod shape-determining protein MreC
LVAPSSGGTASEASLEFRAASYRDTLDAGTLVLSSGLGGVYPKGIPVGTVTGVAREQPGWERIYSMRPAATPSAVAHVMVLTATADSSLIGAFPAESILAAVRADSVRRAAVADSMLRIRISDSVRSWLRDSVAHAPREAAADTGSRQ